jgi:CelD/BcsL family acetyltransferase involved in cellulose biosynthesis
LFEAIGRHISEEKEKNGQKNKKKASRKAGTVGNARLFRQSDNNMI